MPFKELRDGQRIIQKEDGLEGTKVFIQLEPNAEGDCVFQNLPALRDPFSGLYDTLLLRRIEIVPYAFDRSIEGSATDMSKFICEYSTEPDSTHWQNNSYSLKYTGGAKVESVKAGPEGMDWWWLREESDTTVDGTIKNQSIYKTTVQGTFSRMVSMPVDVTLGQPVSWDTYLNGGGEDDYGIMNSLGKINAVAYDGFKIGQVLFLSFDAPVENNFEGVKQYTCTLNFVYLVLNIPEITNGTNVAAPWQYVLNDKARKGEPKYQIPCRQNVDPMPNIRTPIVGGAIVANGYFTYDYIDFNKSLDVDTFPPV